MGATRQQAPRDHTGDAAREGRGASSRASRQVPRVDHVPSLREVQSLQSAAGNASVTWLLEQMPVQRKAGAPPEIYSKEQASAVQDTWKKGASTTTDTFPETKAYAAWKRQATNVIAKMKASKDKATATGAGTLAAWITSFEARQQWLLDTSNGKEPADAGVVPVELSGATVGKGKTLGSPPASPFTLRHQYDVTLPDKTTYQYKDVIAPPKYLTHATGVNKEGTPLSSWKAKDIDALFDEAGVKDVDQRKAILRVSAKEGGFNAINTWDTGFVSVGAIQFTTGPDGNYNIAKLLQTAKTADAGGFDTYFRNLGIDVEPGPQGTVVVVDPDSGAVKRGADAVLAIINDKRLTAVFEHAADNWQKYLVAQIWTAVQQYWIADKTFTIKVDATTTLTGTFGDVLKSEAGRTALLDRAVQNGPGGARKTFEDECAKLAKVYHLKTLDELSAYEVFVIFAVQNRIPVLEDSALSQPPAAPVGDFVVPDAGGSTKAAAGSTASVAV